MADFFVIAELIKYFELDTDLLMIESPFVYKAKITTLPTFTSYFLTTFGAEDDTNKEILNIKGLIVDINNFYSIQTSIDDCDDNEHSFYFDFVNQLLYIHLDHNTSPNDCIIEYGKVYGYTNDKVRTFNSVNYLPLLKSIPSFKLKVDPLRYGRQAFYSGSVIFNNHAVDGSEDGSFDSNIEFTGNDIYLLCGNDSDDYDDLILIANNYIENTIISLDEVEVITKDKREQQSTQAPTDTFTLEEFPDLDPDLVGDIKPDAYNSPPSVPGICVNSENAGAKTFYFASVIQSAPAPVFKKYEDDIFVTVVPSATDYTHGMVTFAVADIHVDGDNSKGIFDVICEGTFIDLQNPGDIIAYLNDRYLSITYNSSNYDTTEWEDEKQYLEDISLYMKDEKELFEWIEIIQNGSTVGFQYLFENNKRTLRLDNPNRTPVRNIQSVEILNNGELKFNNNEDFFATHVIVDYKKNNYTDKYMRYQNDDYYNTVFREHRKDTPFPVECLLATEAQADDKSVILLEDLQKERPTGIITLYGKEFYTLKIFDIIMAEISKPGIKTGHVERTIYAAGRGTTGTTYTADRGTTGYDLYTATRETIIDIIIGYREYLGSKRFQIIGITPDFENETIDIEIREREYSDLFDSITGYTP
jgi:hypothetical protein